jgi:hypothetical protein
MPAGEESSSQNDAVADAVQRLSELAVEIRDALVSIASAVQTLASTGSG